MCSMPGYSLRLAMVEGHSPQVVARVEVLLRRSVCPDDRLVKRRMEEGLGKVLGGGTPKVWVDMIFSNHTPHKKSLIVNIRPNNVGNIRTPNLLLVAEYRSLDTLVQAAAWVVASRLGRRGGEEELGLPVTLLQEVTTFL